MQGSGDVKYHKGFSADVRTPGGNVHVALAFNPSHLEIVNPVVEGSVRARQERRDDAQGDKVVPVLMHGDAAFAGQGVVMETLQLSQARGYRTGGTIHIVINNQIGFTTSDPRDARSTIYCSDVAKMVEAPILHVNADDPEAVVFVTRLALRYRQRFHKDVVIDLVCYRRLGHNEADEPAATQPLMYQVIRQHPTVRKLYADRLVADGVLIARPRPSDMVEQYRQALDAGRLELHPALGTDRQQVHGRLVALRAGRLVRARRAPASSPTGWRRSASAWCSCPNELVLHPRVAQVIANRAKMVAGEMPLDWGVAETLAYASLLDEGVAVRISGQDSGRGTFFHRHAVLHDQTTGRRYMPLQHVTRRPAALHRDRLGAVRGGGGRLRVRLLHHQPGLPGDLGSAVRRFRQRRAGGDRPVHLLGRGEVGPAVRPDAVPAARLRRPGAGAFLGAPRALPAAVRREQHAGVRAVDAGADVSPAAPADAAAVPQAADRDDAQEPAAPRAVGVVAGRAEQQQLRQRHR